MTCIFKNTRVEGSSGPAGADEAGRWQADMTLLPAGDM